MAKDADWLLLEGRTDEMDAIGGYFELELRRSQEFHPEALKLNTARNAFEYVLKVGNYSDVLLPLFTCDVLLEPLIKLGISYRYYSIDSYFKPILNSDELGEHTGLLYINYFGLNNNISQYLNETYSNLIIDNSQAFYSKPLRYIPTFYSPRKFFGIPDGAYLYTEKYLVEKLELDQSHTRFSHLLKRYELDPAAGYSDFVNHECELKNNPIKYMSILTGNLLKNIDYEAARSKRNANFLYLHQVFSEINQIDIQSSQINGPLIYPLLVDSGSAVKDKLIQDRVFVPTYWKTVLERVPKQSVEFNLATHLICLPIDQRYSIEHMQRVVELVKGIL